MLPDLLELDADRCIDMVFPDFKEICFLEDLNRSQEFYLSLSETLLKVVSLQLITSKEFTFHFVELITDKIYHYCDKQTDYGEY